jgi:hypothetical protein
VTSRAELRDLVEGYAGAVRGLRGFGDAAGFVLGVEGVDLGDREGNFALPRVTALVSLLGAETVELVSSCE